MSKTYKDSQGRKTAGKGRQRNISVRAVRRDPPDLRKLSRALISLALAEAAAEADNDASASPADQAVPDSPQNDKAADV